VRKNALVRQAVTVFVAFHIVAIALWALPVDPALTGLVQTVLGPYFSLVGLRQEWSLFAPDPMISNSYVDAQVTLGNGESQNWSFPQLDGLGLAKRYSKARYRKYTGWLYRKPYRYAWHDAARYIARQFKDAASPPLTVRLIRHWAAIPPPGSASEGSPAWRSNVFYVYAVHPEDLQ